MKKHIILPIVLGLGLLFLSNSAKSQNFQIVASFGTAHNWAVPNAVLFEIDYYYPFHQIVHINRERRGRNLFYNVLLERRGQFVELFFGRQAMILDINYYHNYPLAQHICSGHCGYHGNFYRTHQVVCNNIRHSHGPHRGHNHIAYRSGRNYNSYAARNSASNRNVRRNHSTNIRRSDSPRSVAGQNTVNRNHATERRSNSESIRRSSNSRLSDSGVRSTTSNSAISSSPRSGRFGRGGETINRDERAKQSSSVSSSSPRRH